MRDHKLNLTSKDLRAIKLVQQYHKKSLVENLVEYHHLVDTLLHVHEAVANQNIKLKYWEKDSETLLHKFAFHGLTLHQILSGLHLKSTYFEREMNGKTFLDISSAKTVFRSQMEAFLMYRHIYVNPPDDALKELRHNAWIYSSLKQRQQFQAKTEFAKRQKEKDLKEIEKMKSHISGLAAFQHLTANQQKSLLENGNGKLFNQWSKIMRETGFSEENTFHTIWAMLCMYAHSEGLSIIQLGDVSDGSKQAVGQGNLDLHHSKLLVCLMIESITELFPVVKVRFNALPEHLRHDIEIYCMMAKREIG